jgi:hypothetical protein
MGRKKKREQTVVQSFCLEKKLLDKLSEEAKKRGISRSALLEDIVELYFEREPIDLEKALEPFFDENAIDMDKVLESFLGDKTIDIDSFVIVDKEKEASEKAKEKS